jgi:RNA polymerase sigma-70 factor (ECF subfamily)
MSEDKDEVLIKRIKEGNSDAFDTIIRRYMKKAYSIAYDLIGNHQEAEDISQEAFIKVYTNINKFEQKSSFSTWLYRIIVNLCHDYRRRNLILSKLIIFPKKIDSEEQVELKDTRLKSDIVEQVINKELNEAIKKAVDNLPKMQKTVFVLKNFHHLKIYEIAKILNCKEGTVKCHLFRAIQNLKKKLEGYKDVL